MSITQYGANSQASSGKKSVNNQTNNCAVKNASWFIGGILLPTVAGLIVEVLSSGKTSAVLSGILELIK